jgi:hypothetical protein
MICPYSGGSDGQSSADHHFFPSKHGWQTSGLPWAIFTIRYKCTWTFLFGHPGPDFGFGRHGKSPGVWVGMADDALVQM